MCQNTWNDYKKIKNRKPFYQDIISVKGENHRAHFAEIVSPFVNKRTIMLDAGCGIADHLIKYSRGAMHTYGVDYNRSLAREALINVMKNKGISLEIILMDIRHLGFKDDVIDLTTSLFCPLYEKSIGEIHRVLKGSGYLIRCSCCGDFVEYQGKMMRRPQDVLARGAFVWKQKGEVLEEELLLLRKCGFMTLKDNIRTFTGIKVFITMHDFVLHVSNSGHFRFYPPYKPLTEDEIGKLVGHQDEFKIPYKGAYAFGLPFDSFLVIASKP